MAGVLLVGRAIRSCPRNGRWGSTISIPDIINHGAFEWKANAGANSVLELKGHAMTPSSHTFSTSSTHRQDAPKRRQSQQQEHYDHQDRRRPRASPKRHVDEESDDQMIRLSKRMSELDLCSRREADRFIQDGLVLVHGERAVLGQKVNSSLVGPNDIRIVSNHHRHPPSLGQQNPRASMDDNDNISGMPSQNLTHQFVSVILNKPKGYVSAQAEHGNVPAVRLLTLDRLWKTRPSTRESTIASESVLGSTPDATNWRQRIVQDDNNDNNGGDDDDSFKEWMEGLAPAGRLDRDSTGLLILTQSGVLAKKLVGTHKLDKEYIVHVEPAQQVARRERLKQQELHTAASASSRSNAASSSAAAARYIRQPQQYYDDDHHQDEELFQLPPPTLDLRILTRGGAYLQGETRPLKRCRAKWIEPGKILRLTLQEGRKHQIRRSCRQLLGYHVVQLERIRIGPITLATTDGDKNIKKGIQLPEGRWRPLTEQEVEQILNYE